MNQNYKKIKELINSSDAIIIGAGAGLSTSAGHDYSGKRFMDNFKYMFERYGYKDMYSAGFHPFESLEEYWGYRSKFIYINRYLEVLPLYKDLFSLLKSKNYFIITTNVDHQFQKAGFDKERLFYTQGDYGLFQCSEPCHNKTYDNRKEIIKMIENTKNYKIPTELIPKCPICGKPMSMNLRCDQTFVEDDGWENAKTRYLNFLNENHDKKILFLELGVGFNTPVIIKYPFWRLTSNNKKATYVSISLNDSKIINSYLPKDIKNRSIIIDDDIKKIIKELI